MKNRFYFQWFDGAEAYIIYDRQRPTEGNSTGDAVLWGTDHPERSVVEKLCDRMNADPNYVKERFGI